MHKKRFYERFVKRAMDLILSFFAIIIFSPLFIIISILVWMKLGTPIIFKQPRPGLNEKLFNLYKFRTMTNEKDKNGKLLSDEVRLTKFGKFLRSTSLDELPSLYNILIGNLSIVGPRPLLVQYLPLYNQNQRRRHEVRPGLTGLAQINGRNAISWDEKFKYDLEYIESVSLLVDFVIILKTIKKVFAREGISSETSSTMEFFEGSKNSR